MSFVRSIINHRPAADGFQNLEVSQFENSRMARPIPAKRRDIRKIFNCNRLGIVILMPIHDLYFSLITKPACMIFRKSLFSIICFLPFLSFAQPDPWKITATTINAPEYYGVTVANGMIGIVSSPEPFKVKDVVLAGAYDLYGRGRVSNFLKSFNLLNMYLEIDGKRIDTKSAANMQQVLDMKNASFTTSFDYSDKASVSYTYYSLRQLPYTVLMDVTITAKKNI